MTQQTDRLDVVRDLMEVNRLLNEIDTICKGSHAHDLIKRSIAAPSQPAAHPEPENVGALGEIDEWIDSLTVQAAPQVAQKLRDMATGKRSKIHEHGKALIEAAEFIEELAALAKPAVPEIASDDADCIYEALFQMNRTADYLRGKDHHKVCVDNQEMARNAQAALSRLRAYLKLSGQKEGS